MNFGGHQFLEEEKTGGLVWCRLNKGGGGNCKCRQRLGSPAWDFHFSNSGKKCAAAVLVAQTSWKPVQGWKELGWTVPLPLMSGKEAKTILSASELRCGDYCTEDFYLTITHMFERVKKK